MADLNRIREAFPEYKDTSDDELIGYISQRTKMPVGQVLDTLKIAPRGTLAETGRQALGGLVSDLPKMAGQAIQYFTPETSPASEYGKEMAQAAEKRGIGYEPDIRGRGLLGKASVYGARGLAPAAAVIGTSLIPGVGEVVAPAAAATLFGGSSAQETYDKILEQTGDREAATDAARRVGLIQGVGEAAATFVGGRVARGLSPMLGIGGKTTAGVAANLTETGVAKPFLKNMAINSVVQPATEVAQDLGTYAVEQAYGAKKEDPYAIAEQSALGGFGLNMFLGAFGLGSHVRRAKQAQALDQMLYGENTTPEQQLSARRMVVDEARRQGVPAQDAEAWFQRQYREDAAALDDLKLKEDAVIESGKESPLADISYALTDPDLGPKISDTDREQLVQLMNTVRLGNLPPQAEAAIVEQANNILGQYFVAEQDQNQEHDLTQPAGLQRTPSLFAPTPMQEINLAGGLTQVQTNLPPDQTAYAPPQGLGREMPRATPVAGVPGVSQVAPGIFQAAPQLQQVETKPQAVAPVAPTQVSPPGAPAAVAAVTPATPVVAGASLKAPKRGPKTPKTVKAETQGQEVAAAVAPVAAEVAAPATAEDKHLAKLLEDVDSVDVGQPLPAAVRGAETVKAPGRTSMGTEGLKQVRDALLNDKGRVDKKQQRIVDALANFASMYKAYSDQGGQAVSRRESIPKSKTAEQYAGEQVSGTEYMADNVQAALAELGQAVGGNAKDIEAIVRLVKDMVQGKIVAPGKTRSEVIQAGKKIDTMLSQAWASAKRETFMGATPDLMDVRSGEIRNAREQGGKVSPLEKAATEGVANPKGKGEKFTGLQGVLQYIRSSGTPFERMLAATLRDVFNSQMSDVKLEFITEGDPRFDPKTNTVYLRKNESPEVALHEALHAALQSFIYKNPKDPAVMQLKRSLKAVVNYKGELTGKAKEVQDLLKKLVAEKNELDAVLELVSYGTTLNDFRKALEAMPSKGVPQSFRENVLNVWRYIRAAMARMLGKPNTVAANVLDNSIVLLEKASRVKPESNTGNILEAAVTTTKPVSDAKVAETLGMREQDFSRYNKGNAVQLQLTQRGFEAVGWNKANMEKLTGKAGDKARELISKNFPGAEIVLGWINSRYNVNETVSQIMDRYKLNKGIGYQYAEDLANVISRRPAEDVNALFAYLDGDKKALDKLPDAMKLKAVADKLDEWFKLYVAELTPVEQKYFNSRKFSESLLFPVHTEQVAGGTFGLGHINEVLGLKRKSEVALDDDWFQKDDNGELVTGGDIFQVFETDGVTPAGFMSAARHAELGSPNTVQQGAKMYTVDTTRRWLEEDKKGDKYSFVTNTTAKEKIADQKADDVANALRNTIAALANNYASKNFIKSVFDMGRGDSAHAQVAFDSLEELNKAFGTNVLENQVLPISREISRSPQTKALYRQSGTWVKLPADSPVYGELAGKYLPGPVWNAMGDMSDRQPIVNWRAANNTMRWFKKSKTVWNIGTHVTNTASNVTMAMMHDISFSTMGDASRILAKYEVSPKSLTPSELALMMAFRDSGAMLADYSSAEVKEALYKAHALNLRGGEDVSVMRRVGGWLGIEKSKAEALEKLTGKAGKYANMADEVASQMYAAEDNIFRLAAFLKTAGALQAREGLKTPTPEMLREAGLFARKAFGDYDIDSKAVKVGRQTVMPFISWFYAMAPVIGRIAVYEPWKFANVLTAYMILEAAMGGAAGDDDEEKRKEGPDSIRERMFGSVGPYTHIRIPFMGDSENPVYYKLGDYFPTSSFTRGLPNGMAGQSWIPASVTPSGPFVSAILGLVGGVDPYTGKSLHQPTDTEWQKLWTSTKFMYDTATVPLINSKNISKVNDMLDEKTGITGAEPSSLFIARAFGMKFYDFNVNEQAAINEMATKRIQSEFKTAMTKAKRDEYRKGYPDYEALDAKLEELRTRMEEEIAKKRGEE